MEWIAFFFAVYLDYQTYMINVEYQNLDDIVEADSNPKDHDLGVLYQSMKRFGFTEPIMMNEHRGKLLAGNGDFKFKNDESGRGGRNLYVQTDTEDKTQYWYETVITGISIENVGEAQAYLLADNSITEYRWLETYGFNGKFDRYY